MAEEEEGLIGAVCAVWIVTILNVECGCESEGGMGLGRSGDVRECS